MTTALASEIKVWVGIDSDEATIEAGPEAVVALRRDAIRSLHEALTEIKAAEEDMPLFSQPEARDGLERLGAALSAAQMASNALWFLAPDPMREGT